MKNTLKISLKPNEKIYLNGAVIRVDRKTTIELLNETQFLLESQEQSRRWVNLQEMLLLLLRTAAVALAVFMLAGPTMRRLERL